MDNFSKSVDRSKERDLLSLSVIDYGDVCISTPRSGDAISAGLHGMPAPSADAQSDELIQSVAIHGYDVGVDVNHAEPESRCQQRRSRDLVVIVVLDSPE